MKLKIKLPKERLIKYLPSLLIIFIIILGFLYYFYDQRKIRKGIFEYINTMNEVTTLGYEYEFLKLKTNYILRDIHRDTIVGILYTKNVISKGDRIFLGEDMYDVLYIKIIAEKALNEEKDKTGNFQNQQAYSVKNIGLLVKFSGKASVSKE